MTDSGTNGAGEAAPSTSSAGLSIRALSALLDRYHFANQAGLGFDTSATHAAGFDRDYYLTLGYPKSLRVEHFRSEYERGGIAERIVEAYPLATWAGETDLQEDPDPGVETDFERASRELFSRLEAWPKLLRADILSGIGSYGGILIGAPGPLDQELPTLTSPDQILYLRPLAEDACTVKTIVGEQPGTATDDPRFGLPETYSVKIAKARTEEVHWSRVIHVVDQPLDDEIQGKPRLRPIYNYLQDLLKIVGGGSEATWRRVNRLTLFDLDPELEIDSTEADNLRSQVEDVVHGLKSYATTRGVTPKDLTGSVPTISANADTLIKLISGTTGIPSRILMGSERGELASSQDRSNWSDRIQERRESFAAPLVRSLVDRLVKYGALPEYQDLSVVWPDRDELTEVEKGEVAASIARANSDQVKATGEPLLTSDEVRDSLLKRPPLAESGWEPRTPEPPTDDGARAAESFDRTDDPPSEPEWKAVHRAADAELPGFVRTLTGVWEAASDALDEDDLAERFAESRYIGEARVMEVLADLDSIMRSAVRDRIAQSLAAGGRAALRSARARGSFFRSARAAPRGLAEFSADFDATNPRALEWAREQSSTLITEIGPDTVAAMQTLIAEGFEQGIPPRKLAQQVRQSIGLRTDQVRAVGNLRAELLAADPGTVVERFPPSEGIRSQSGFRAKVPAGGATEEWADRQLARYRRMQLNYRARTIARRETIYASNRGQKELWFQARDGGQIPRDQKRVLITTPDERRREEHALADGQVVGLDEPFDLFDGTTEPGQAPNCRCAQGLATPADLERAGLA